MAGRGLARAFAVRALGRTGPLAAADMAKVAVDRAFLDARCDVPARILQQ